MNQEQVSKVIEVDNFGKVEITHMFVNSKLAYHQTKLNDQENQATEINNKINLIDISLRNLQKTFPKIFPDWKHEITENPHHALSEKIEQFVLNLLGKNVIVWENSLFIINKCLFIDVMIILILFRPDLLTLTLSSIILGLEVRIIGNKHLNNILRGLILSIICDLLWFLFYLLKFRSFSYLEGEYSHTTYRKLSVILSGVEIVFKLIIIFLVWRLSLTQNLNEIPHKRQINRSKSSHNAEENKEDDIIAKSQDKFKNLRNTEGKKSNKYVRPQLKGTRTVDLKIDLRFQ